MANAFDTSLQFHAAALNLRAQRQELLASNIANADTPEYKARDIDFGKSLQEALAGRMPGTQLTRTAGAHITPAQEGNANGAALYRTVLQPSLDGNTVDMDVERAQFAENAVHYEANLMFINSQLKAMLAAIQGVIRMSLFKMFDIAAGALTAQSQRLNTVASNLANADSAAGPDGKAYRAKQVVFETVPLSGEAAASVRVTDVIEDPSPGRQLYDPRHPLADPQGYVTMPNVNPVDEMVNMISASRSYQNNVEVMNTAKTLLLKTLQLGS